MGNYIDYLVKTMEELKKEEKELIATSRKDEANFIRIKINICDICKTIYHVSAKNNSGMELKEEYVKQLTRLPENWKISLEKAKAHNDIEKIIVEETKLEMLQIIRDKLEELGAWE